MTTKMIRSLILGLLISCQYEGGWAFQAMQSRLKKTTKSIVTSSSLFYRTNTTETPFAPTSFSGVEPPPPASEYNNYSKQVKKIAGSWTLGRREVDRDNTHPIFKLGWIPEEVPLAAIAVMAVLFSPVVLPLLPMIIISRKKRWETFREESKEEHKVAFEQTISAYRKSQRVLVDKLLEAQKQPLSPEELPKVIAVTMATGQEGQGVVKGLAEAPQFQHATILALVRNPKSRASQALEALSPNIKLVECDSTDVASLQRALEPAEAVFLATTLNQAPAGKWKMEWNGGQYQVQQGKAFAEACTGLKNLRHVVYGTAPMRKWPESFAVEPPIHYAAKWRNEQILESANLPMTFLRKCPYHENFTKLTEAKKKSGTSEAVAAMGVEAGGAFDLSRKVELEEGHYKIKAMTPPEFTYNMMDPRDTGKWAVLAFSYPSILVGQSLSVASDALTGKQMAREATDCGALGDGVTFSYSQQPRWLFETLAFLEPTFVYISGLQRWNIDGGQYDLDADGVKHARKLVAGSTWSDHLEREGLGQFTETMEDLLPRFTKF